jgi:transcriptional regulator with XRE-family HTH domain
LEQTAMAKKSKDDTAYLLKYLLAVELYRAGLTQAQIRERLGLDINTLNSMLKGVDNHLLTRPGS